MSTPKKCTKTELSLLADLLKRAVLNEQQFPSDVRITLGTPECEARAEPATNTDGVVATLNERGSRYGDFTTHARLAQSLQDALRFHTIIRNEVHHYPWDDLDAVKKQALIVITDKLARIMNGDANYADNWHDLQDYAKLVEDRLIE